MDLNIFYPASLNGAGRQNRVVLAMHRKGSFRRGAHILTEAMRLVKQARPDVTVRFFGDDLGTSTFEYEYAGRLPHKKLAACYRQADIYVDASMVHGFGRPGVEAMACGAVLVSTDSGGVREYAVDGENCLLAAVGDARDVADKVIRLLDDEILRKRLRIRALESIESYAEPIAAGQFLEWIDHLYNQKRTDLS